MTIIDKLLKCTGVLAGPPKEQKFYGIPLIDSHGQWVGCMLRKGKPQIRPATRNLDIPQIGIYETETVDAMKKRLRSYRKKTADSLPQWMLPYCYHIIDVCIIA